MKNDPTNPFPGIGALMLAAALFVVGMLIGCAIRATQSIDWFGRDHSRHETNALPATP